MHLVIKFWSTTDFPPLVCGAPLPIEAGVAGGAMLLKTCPRCGKPIEVGRRHCRACAKQVADRSATRDKKREKYYNKYKRDPKTQKFYKSSAWKRLSRTYLQDIDYKCEECGALATEVHHKKPIQTPEGWIERFEWENLQGLCTKCHNKKRNGRGR